jgi:threonine dehydrogenase-like Zn-dependent dehydrogenase
LDIHATQIATTPEPISEIRELVSLAERGWWDPKLLKTNVTSIDNIQEACENYMSQKDNVIKTVLKF